MRLFVVSTLISCGLALYLSTSMKGSLPSFKNLENKPTDSISTDTISLESTSAPHASRPTTKAVPPDPKAPVRMVQIQGRWYTYRPDNRYLVDGVPTLYIPTKRETTFKPEPPIEEANDPAPTSLPASAVADRKESAAPSKNKQLPQMAMDNPTAVYTPDGMRALKDGLEALKTQAAERKQTLDSLTNEQ